MNKQISDIEKEIITNIENEFKNNVVIPDYNTLMLKLYYIFAYTGQANIMYCNSFIYESIQLLKNSLILYKNGFFDCAFYSIRQSSEVMDNMLYVANNPKILKDWKTKGYFPVDSKIQKQLEQISEGYKEIKTILSEYFLHHEELIKKSHKIIHKQGFDTFYQLRIPINKKITGFTQEKELELFLETLKYTIGKLHILLVLLDPMTLALSDENINCKIAMNLMTEPIDINFFSEVLGLTDIIDKLKSSNYYKDFVSYFEEKEVLLPSTYLVIRENYWDINALDEIEKQIHLLNIDEIFMFNILKNKLKINRFYMYDGMLWYSTSNCSNIHDFSVNTLEFRNYTQQKNLFNQHRKNVYVSVIKKSKEDWLFIEHNDLFNKEDIKLLLSLEKKHLEYIERCELEVNNIVNSF